MAAKRRELTTDDLLRMQEEGPSRKRVRHAALLEDSDGSDEEFEQIPSGSENDEEGQDNSSSGSGSGSGTDSEEVVSEDEEAPLPPQILQAEEDLGEDDGTSRVSFMPRKSFQEKRHPLIAPPIKPTSFEALEISPALITALTKMSIKRPTEIQAACIPPLIQGESDTNHVSYYARLTML